jgi:hypothetical protein
MAANSSFASVGFSRRGRWGGNLRVTLSGEEDHPLAALANGRGDGSHVFAVQSEVE